MPRHIPPELAAAMADMVRRYRPDLTRPDCRDACRDPGPAPSGPLPESLTKADICRVGKVSLATVNRWLKRRQLPSVKVGRLVRVPRSAVEQLLAAAPAEG